MSNYREIYDQIEQPRPKPPSTNAFITGSHAYGEPHADSDVDLVVRADVDDMSLLRELSGCRQGPIRFGQLNLIVCTNDELFTAWQKGTEQLMAEGRETGLPVTRERACEVLKARRAVLPGQEPS